MLFSQTTFCSPPHTSIRTVSTRSKYHSKEERQTVCVRVYVCCKRRNTVTLLTPFSASLARNNNRDALYCRTDDGARRTLFHVRNLTPGATTVWISTGVFFRWYSFHERQKKTSCRSFLAAVMTTAKIFFSKTIRTKTNTPFSAEMLLLSLSVRNQVVNSALFAMRNERLDLDRALPRGESRPHS